MARKAQAASEIQPIVESENIPVGNVVSSQHPGESYAVENNDSKAQNSSVITNQEAVAVLVNAPVTPSAPVPKSEETVADSECKEGM